MAKKRERIATGLSVKDVMSMTEGQLLSYTPSQQREIVSRLASATNKRIRGLEKKGFETPALLRIQHSGGNISVKGKTGADLINEFNRAKRFMTSPSSSVTGWKKIVKKIEKDVKEKLSIEPYEGTDSSDKQQSKLPEIKEGMTANQIISNAFALFDVLSESNPELVATRDRYKLTRKIAEMLESGMNYEDSMLTLYNQLLHEEEETRQQYEQLQEESSLGNRLTNDVQIPKRYKRNNKRKKRRG